MDKIQEVDINSNQQFLEKVDQLEDLMSRFRRQVEKYSSLRRKIGLLLEELKRLNVSIKTSKREINLTYKELTEASSQVLTEAFFPNSEEWKIQYELKKQEEVIQELDKLLETYLVDPVEYLQLKFLT